MHTNSLQADTTEVMSAHTPLPKAGHEGMGGALCLWGTQAPQEDAVTEEVVSGSSQGSEWPHSAENWRRSFLCRGAAGAGAGDCPASPSS